MIKALINQYKNNIRLKQVISLLSWNIFGIPLGIITSVVVTRFLGPQNYGDYMFINNIFNISILLLNFGFFQAGNRALVLTNDKKKAKEYYGAELIIIGGIYFFIVVSLFVYAVFDINIKQKGLQTSFMYIIPFAWVYLLTQYFEVLFPADNKISLLVKSRYYPKLGFCISSVIIYFFFKNFLGNKLFIIWAFFLFTQITVYLYILNKVKLSLNNLKIRIKEIWIYNKTFGFNVYVGSLFSNVFAQLAGLLISYFGADNAGVGYYTLAITLVSPLSFIPNVIATTHYKDFSNFESVPKKLLKITIATSLIALLFLWLIIPPFINLFYRKEFVAVIKLSYIVSIGVFLYGLSDFFTRFLGAHGNGKALRNSSIIVGLCVLIFNATLVPLWHETGAVITYLIAGVMYFATIFFYYKKFIKNN